MKSLNMEQDNDRTYSYQVFKITKNIRCINPLYYRIWHEHPSNPPVWICNQRVQPGSKQVTTSEARFKVVTYYCRLMTPSESQFLILKLAILTSLLYLLFSL